MMTKLMLGGLFLLCSVLALQASDQESDSEDTAYTYVCNFSYANKSEEETIKTDTELDNVTITHYASALFDSLRGKKNLTITVTNKQQNAPRDYTVKLLIDQRQ